MRNHRVCQTADFTDNTIRANAEQKLEDLGDASITAIEKVLRDLDPETKVLRGVAAKFLARIKSPRALPALLFSVNNDEDTFTRVNAIHSLAKIGIANSEVLSTLGEALFDLDEDVRTAAAEALGAFGEPAGEYGIDLLLLSHSSSARFAWACRVAAGKAAPGIMSFTDDNRRNHFPPSYFGVAGLAPPLLAEMRIKLCRG